MKISSQNGQVEDLADLLNFFCTFNPQKFLPCLETFVTILVTKQTNYMPKSEVYMYSCHIHNNKGTYMKMRFLANHQTYETKKRDQSQTQVY